MPDIRHFKHIDKHSRCAMIVAHPDDETLWAGGLMLMHPDAEWTVVTICRKSDADRATNFFKALEEFGAKGFMGDFDDGPEQTPLNPGEVQRAIVKLLPYDKFDLIVTHGPNGEYTRHIRHEETEKAVMALWRSARLRAGQVWSFAYRDGGGEYLPLADRNADLYIRLPDDIWQRKYDIITKIYGFGEDSFEAKTTPRQEAFWRFGAGVKK
ncbi:MAG: PIG-L family deacetylase [Phycisphaerae bacterium]|nr:PIG-L family deacetylase [Phycisphaerae bacterium]